MIVSILLKTILLIVSILYIIIVVREIIQKIILEKEMKRLIKNIQSKKAREDTDGTAITRNRDK